MPCQTGNFLATFKIQTFILPLYIFGYHCYSNLVVNHILQLLPRNHNRGAFHVKNF